MRTALLTTMLLLAAGGCAAPEWGSVREVAGERQRVECRGTTGPAVVFVHGIGDRAGSSSFREVADRLPEARRFCVYDRPGAGDSPEPSRPGRDGAQLDRELDGVVREADPARPVLLVGHSFGSYPVLAYTAAHRERVAGVVLLDGVDPRLGLRAALGAESWADVAMAREGLDLAAVQRQTAAAVEAGAAAFADLPLTVVRRGEQAPAAWRDAQQRLAGLSGRGELVVAEGAGHEIPADAPATVVTAIG